MTNRQATATSKIRVSADGRWAATLRIVNALHVARKHDGFDSLPQGCLIDVEYLLGLRPEPKKSEAVTTATFI